MPFSGLAGRETTAGLLAFVAVMLGSVGFDGLSRSPFWQNLRADVEGPYILDSPGTRRAGRDGARARGPARLHPRSSRSPTSARRDWPSATVESERSLAPEFVRSLVPIALVYAVAHYFTLL